MLCHNSEAIKYQKIFRYRSKLVEYKQRAAEDKSATLCAMVATGIRQRLEECKQITEKIKIEVRFCCVEGGLQGENKGVYLFFRKC